MRPLSLARPGERLSILCLGAHADDIEIGAAGALLGWIAAGVRLHVHWCVFSAAGARAAEAKASAGAFLADAAEVTVELAAFDDSFFPYRGEPIKRWLAELSRRTSPDLVFTHQQGDAHQDHREIAQLTRTAFRDHLVLEYEIPKWDGDLGQPNVYIPLSRAVLERKIELLHAHFGSQRGKDWFDAETFRGLARLRGMECRAPERYAEAFMARKAIIG
jgi:LmbE family N-acetylglucosaminyl deacetylase